MSFKLNRLLSNSRQLLKTKIKKSSNLFILLAIFYLLFLIEGCGYPDKYPSHFVKISDRPNAFRMCVIQPVGLFQPRERICGVRVTERSGIHSDILEVCWEVRATEPVDAEGFEIVAGQIPKGFKQVIPSSGQRFNLVPKKQYHIEVDLEHPLAMPWVDTPWIADKE